MKCLIIVNESPWQTGLSLCALRFAHAAITAGMTVSAVFFREDGVYNSLPGTVTDAGTPELASSWKDFSDTHGARLLLCSSSSQRRIPTGGAEPAFLETGLAEMLELMQQSERVISF